VKASEKVANVDVAGLRANSDPNMRVIQFAEDARRKISPIVVNNSSGSAAGKSSCAARARENNSSRASEVIYKRIRIVKI
jgi:hypothetical protein